MIHLLNQNVNGVNYNVVKVLAFIEEEHLKEWIKENQRNKFTIVKYEPITIKTEILISLS